MRRLFAVLVAAGMIVASLVIRSRLDADETGTATPTDDLRVTCSTELEAACRALGGDKDVVTLVEPAGTTADRLATVAVGADPGLDGWLVPNPWPELVNERRRTSSLPPLLTVEGQPIVRSPLRLAVSKARAEKLAPVCAGSVTWRCLGDAAVDGYWAKANEVAWGPIKPGHAEPDTDAVGLLVLGQAVVSYFGRTDVSTIDLDADDRFQQWFSELEKHIPLPPSGGSPLNQMLITTGAAYDAVGTTEAEATQLGVAAGNARVDLLYPEPMATADVVLATTGTTASKSARRTAGGDTVRKALTDDGWRSADASNLPSTNGLPSGGLLLQLQNRWHGVTGR